VTAIETFIDSAVWHGGLERANAMLTADPTLADLSIFTAAILGDDASVRRFLAVDRAAAKPIRTEAVARPVTGPSGSPRSTVRPESRTTPR
jgi:hypothetical protein